MSSVVLNGIRFESPLADIGRDRDVLVLANTSLHERGFLGHINLRGNAADNAFTTSTGRVLGVALPITPNTVHASGERAVYWLCPSEWLIVCAHDEEQSLADQLGEALSSQFASVVRIGGGQTVFCLDGPDARDILARGCPLDLHPRAFADGQCAQTHVAKAPVLLRCVAGGIEVVVRRSFADYLWGWLKSVAAA